MKLFHATFVANLRSIQEKGLGAVQKKNYDFSTPGVVCFTDDPDVAVSFCETAEETEEHIYESGIACLSVDTKDICKDDLYIDPNNKDENLSSFAYKGVIPSNLLNFEFYEDVAPSMEEEVKKIAEKFGTKAAIKSREHNDFDMEL